jgi:lipopolysaccharide transport system ATP-binding protein
MSQLAIRATGLSKQYRLGAAKLRHNTLRDELAFGFKRIFRRNGRLRSGSDRIWALKDVSFDIKEGEALGIIGLNGAGKSTLLKLLSRITEPTEGRGEVYGRLGALLEVGTGFHYELTGRENVYLSGAILGMRKAEIDQKFDAIVDFAELERFIDTPVKHYSSGMFVRLAFAVAAHLDPDILLVDEVLSVGDLGFQRKCTDYMLRLRERDATVIVVSHNMFAVKTLCDRAIYLAQGRVRFDGAAEEAIALYERESRLGTAPWAYQILGRSPTGAPIRITDVQLFDEGGIPRAVFDHGERIRVCIEFDAPERVMHPNFNVSFFRSDNLPCCNYNTAMDGVPIPWVEGKGAIEAMTPPLKLVADVYSIHVMVWDARFERLYAAQVGATCHVRHRELTKHFGVFHEPAAWRWLSGENGLVGAGAAPGVARS